MKTNHDKFHQGNPYKRPTSPFYYFLVKDPSGRIRRYSSKTKDLAIARQMLAAKQMEIEKQKVGFVDRFATTRTMPLEQLIADYRRHLEVERSAPRYVKGVIRQLREFVAASKVGTLSQVLVADAERFIGDIRATKSAKTRDHYAGALRSFGRWLCRTGRWDVDPFQGIATRTATRDKDRKFRRVGFLFAEAERLVEAAWTRFEAERAKGGQPTHACNDDGDAVRDRQVLYWFALTTAFRANECASVRWEDLQLDGDKSAVRLAGQFTKNGDDAHIPLQSFVCDLLKDLRRRRSKKQLGRSERTVTESDLVFHVPDKIAELVRKDAQFAGLIPQRGPTSKRVDFHALRKSCARILIELGLHPKMIQMALRHSDIRITMDLYGELGENDLFRELSGKFPVPQVATRVNNAVGSGGGHARAGSGTTSHANSAAINDTSREVRHA